MGVPSFYRWLVNKYPKIVADAGGGSGDENSPAFDNLYLDMNGIIHPCFHPDDDLFPPTTFDEVFRRMHDYIDHLFDLVRPQKLLFMAIDGVAPRGKMNQQRTRRFRSAMEAKIAEEFEDRLRKLFENEGKVVLPKEDSQLSDSNVITPGTEFMHMLSENLRIYINRRINENPAWGNIKVILSDDKATGEGEHKIMSFIRAQRSSSGYDPNTRHCLYGLDADLIMLALSTHEIHFSILREDVLTPNREVGNRIYPENRGCAETTNSVESRGWFKENPWQPSSGKSVIDTAKSASSHEDRFPVSKRVAYQFLNVSVLREYLALDIEIPAFEKFEYDFERIIDDFIFICFFAGNDFLPHMPSIEIHEGCIDLLMAVYKKEFRNLGGYLVNMQKADDTKGGYIKLSRVERYILAVGAYEERIFSKRTQITDRKMSRILAEYREAKEDEKNNLEDDASSDIVGMNKITHMDKLKISAPAVNYVMVLENTKELKKNVKDHMRKQSDLCKDGSFGTDKVKFGTLGWKERYYKEKFSAENAADMESVRKSVVAEYGKGLCWVLLYYFSGVPSWTWFYPYHYGPCASDFRGLSQLKVKFQKGLPFRPLVQLMAVLPPMSSHALPEAYKGLMVDQISKIIDFYPTEFEIDADGKRFLWQGICKLPFIDEKRLLMETMKLESELKDHEKIRNEETPHRLFLRSSSTSRQQLLSCRERNKSEKIKNAMVIESEIQGLKGTIHVMHVDMISKDDGMKCEYSTDDECMFYEVPHLVKYIPRLLEGVTIPEKTVSRDNLEETVLWHEHHRHGTWRNNNTHRPQFHKPDMLLKGAGNGFSYGRGKTSVPPENPPSRNAAGLFQPSFRRNDQGFQESGPHHRATTSSYRTHDSNFWQHRGGSACQDWRVRPSGDDWAGNYVDVSWQSQARQQTNTSFAPNGGRGRGTSFVPNGGRGRGTSFAPNGGRGRGQGRSATKS